MSRHFQDPHVFSTTEEVVVAVQQQTALGVEMTARDVCKLLSGWVNSISQQTHERDIYGCEGASIRVLRQGEHPLQFSAWHGTPNVVCDLSAVHANTLVWGVVEDNEAIALIAAIRQTGGTWQAFRYLHTNQGFTPDVTWLHSVQTTQSDRRGNRSRRGPRGYRRYS